MYTPPCQFNWQNPYLRKTIYPYREEKLRDFLLIYQEVDLVKESKALPVADRVGFVQNALEPYRQELLQLDHAGLMKRVVERFDREPGRFPRWLQYMVVHFSGMRYRCAHRSWIEPRAYLIELEKKRYDEAYKGLMFHGGIDAFKSLKAEHLQRLKEMESMPDEEILGCLEELGPAGKGEIPDWAWAELVRGTELRLKFVTAQNAATWEGLTPAQLQARTNTPYKDRKPMDEWLKGDMTAWRARHHKTLSLVVISAVCNELSEHIHHLRGLNPRGEGLSGRPRSYLLQELKVNPRTIVEKRMSRGQMISMREKATAAAKKQEKSGAAGSNKHQEVYLATPTAGPYLRRPLDLAAFKPGASILWLKWVAPRPNAWQITNPFGDYNFMQGDGGGWQYGMEQADGKTVFTRFKPAPEAAKPKRKSEKKTDIVKTQPAGIKQWLRWAHEAIVIETVEMLDGIKVLTFDTETRIGVNIRHPGDLIPSKYRPTPLWFVFVGYVPEVPLDPLREQRLSDMLDRQRILAPEPDMSRFELPAPFALVPFARVAEPIPVDRLWATLTRRQKQVVALFCQGLSLRQIATELDTSQPNVRAHLNEGMKKLGVHNRMDLIALLANFDFGELTLDSSF